MMMSKRLSDDEKRYFTDQISMLKGENERLTKIVEQAELDYSAQEKVRELEAENLQFIKANVEVAKINANLVEENEDLKEAGQELVSRVEQFTNEWSKDAWPFLDLAVSKMNDALLTPEG